LNQPRHGGHNIFFLSVIEATGHNENCVANFPLGHSAGDGGYAFFTFCCIQIVSPFRPVSAFQNSKQKTTVIMHKAYGGLCDCAVNRQAQKPFRHVWVLGSMTVLGSVLIYSVAHGVRVVCGELVGYKRLLFLSYSLFEVAGYGAAQAPQS